MNSPDLFISNRQRLRQLLPANALAVLNANDIPPTNGDGSAAMTPNSDLFYLSGVEQEESILLLYPDADDEKAANFSSCAKPRPKPLAGKAANSTKRRRKREPASNMSTGWRNSPPSSIA